MLSVVSSLFLVEEDAMRSFDPVQGSHPLHFGDGGGARASKKASACSTNRTFVFCIPPINSTHRQSSPRQVVLFAVSIFICERTEYHFHISHVGKLIVSRALAVRRIAVGSTLPRIVPQFARWDNVGALHPYLGTLNRSSHQNSCQKNY